jgi:hypothetical protein
MDSSGVTDCSTHTSVEAPRGPHGPGGPDPGAVSAVIAAVGATYVSTHSLAATVVASCAGLACAAVLAWGMTG